MQQFKIPYAMFLSFFFFSSFLVITYLGRYEMPYVLKHVILLPHSHAMRQRLIGKGRRGTIYSLSLSLFWSIRHTN